MNWTQRQLRMFVMTAQHLNVSRASENLHISQPALSRSLQELEAQLGVLLFRRSTRALTLTPDAEQFLPVAQRLLRDLEQATVDLRERATGLTGSVTVALGSAFGCAVLPAVVKAFSVSHPGVRLRLVDDNSAGIAARVMRTEADIGVGSPMGDPSSLVCTLLLTAPLGLLFNPEHFHFPESPTAEDLIGLPLLREVSESSVMHALRHRASPLLQQMDRGTEVSSLALQLAMAAAGAGIAVVSALGASHPQAKTLRFVPLCTSIDREVFIMRRRDRSLNPSAQAFEQALLLGTTLAPLHPAVRTLPKSSSLPK